jgi:hypothetical protein
MDAWVGGCFILLTRYERLTLEEGMCMCTYFVYIVQGSFTRSTHEYAIRVSYLWASPDCRMLCPKVTARMYEDESEVH